MSRRRSTRTGAARARSRARPATPCTPFGAGIEVFRGVSC